MKMHSLLAIMALGFAFAVAMPAHAEFLNKASAEKLLNGNTMEGKDFKFGREVKIYFATDGAYKKLDDLNNKDTGTWHIVANGMLCMRGSRHSENCRAIQPAKKEGKYLLIKNGKKSVRIDRVVPGNPHNL